MHGLAVFQHHIVGDVHNVVDGPDAAGAEALPHPLGGGGDLHVPHHPGGVPGTEVRVRGLHVQELRQGAGQGVVRVLGAALHHGLVELHGLVECRHHLPGKADDAEAVGPVGGDFKLHHMVVRPDDGLDIVAGFAVLVEDKNAVGDAVGELLLLCAEVRQGADGLGFGVVGHQIALVDILEADVVNVSAAFPPVQGKGPVPPAVVHHQVHPGADHRPEELVPRLDVCGNGGLFRVHGLVVVQQGGGGDGGVGEIPLVQAQLMEAAHHAVGQHAPQLAPGDFFAAGEGGVMLGYGDQIPLVNVPGSGDDLNRLLFPDVHLTDPHMVAVGMTLHLLDAAHNDVLNLRPQVLRDLHLGAGDGHGLGEVPVADRADVYKFL